MYKGIVTPASGVYHRGGKSRSVSMSRGSKMNKGMKSSAKGMIHSPAKTMHNPGRKHGSY